MKSFDNNILVIPVGSVPAIASKVIAAHIAGHLDLAVDILPPLRQPVYAYNAPRSQYDAARIIDFMESRFLDRNAKLIGILDVDIFVPLFTHCLGEARQGGRGAVVSLHRLQAGTTEQIGLERAAKVAFHELGHLFNLLHCNDRRCLMHFSSEPADLDPVAFRFCRYCSRFLQDAIYEWQK